MADNMRPRVILHILQSVDGRVSGGFFGKVSGLVGEYGRIRREFDADCFVHGATTARELYARGAVRHVGGTVPAGDYVAQRANRYLAIVDPDGTLGFTDTTCSRPGMEGAHFVQLLRADVDPAYLAYLRSVGISYVLAGTGALDVELALQKLGELFGVRTVLLMGGGFADGTFAAAGCVDELSLVVAPVAQVQSGPSSLFETVPGLSAKPLALELRDVERLQGSGLWLHYVRA